MEISSVALFVVCCTRERETHTHTPTRETKLRKHVGIQKSKTFVIMPLMKYGNQSEALVVAEIHGDEIKSRHRGEPQRERERERERVFLFSL
jgi:hypothetical protein